MTPLTCRACGTIDVPRVESGAGPHWGQAVCSAYDAHRWGDNPWTQI